MAWANTGAAPSVDIPITSGERLTMAPKAKSQKAGLSITFTGTPRARAAVANFAATSSSSKAPIAIAAPVEIVGRPATTIDGDGATRWTFGDLEQFVRRVRRVDFHQRTRRGQQFGFPCRGRTSARHHGAFAVERQKNRQASQ